MFIINSYRKKASASARVLKGSAQQTNGTTVALNGVGSVNGELLVAVASLTHTGSTPNLTISDSQGLTWTKVQRTADGTRSVAATFFYAVANGTTTNITVTSAVTGTTSIMDLVVYGYVNNTGVGASGTAGGVHVAELVTMTGSTATSSEILALAVAAQNANLTLSPVSPSVEIYERDLAHTSGTGYSAGTGSSMEISLTATKGLTGIDGGAVTRASLADVTAASNTVTTASIATTNGALLVAVVTGGSTSLAPDPTVSGGSLTWIKQTGTKDFATRGAGVAIYTATATGTSITVTGSFTAGSVNTVNLKVYQYTGANAVGAVGAAYGAPASAVSFTSVGSTTNDGLTAVVNSVATVSGRLYAVLGYGAANQNGGVNYYDDLSFTTSGPTVTRQVFQRSYDRITPLAAIGTFVGTGSTISVTCTMGSVQGTPSNPITACHVVEVQGSNSVGRNTSANTDIGSGGGWTQDLVIAGTVTSNAKVLGGICTAWYPSLGSFTAGTANTQLATGGKAHASGAGYSGTGTGTNLSWATESTAGLTSSFVGSADEYRSSSVSVEFLPSAGGGAGSTSVTLGAAPIASSEVLAVFAGAQSNDITVAPAAGWTEVSDVDMQSGGNGFLSGATPNSGVSINTQVQSIQNTTSTNVDWTVTGNSYTQARCAIEIRASGVTYPSVSWTMSTNDTDQATAMAAIEIKAGSGPAVQAGSVRVNLTGSDSGNVDGSVFTLQASTFSQIVRAVDADLLGSPAPIIQGTYTNGWSPQDTTCGHEFRVTVPSTGSYSLRFYYSAQLSAATKDLFVNGSSAGSASFPFAGSSWEDFSTFSQATVTLNSGANTIRITSNAATAADGYVNLDRVEVTQALSVVGTITISSGFGVLNNVAPGSYTLVQSNTLSGYTAAGSQSVSVTSNAQAVVTLVNQAGGGGNPTPGTGTLRVNLTGTDGGNVDGALFTLTQGVTSFGTTFISSGFGVISNLVAGTYTLTETSATVSYNSASPQTVSITSNNQTVVNLQVTPTGIQPSGVVVGHTNTANRLAPPSDTPTGSGILRSPSANVNSIQSALNAAQPGDVIQIPAGTYSGQLNLSCNGTNANRILIRPVAGAAVTWSSGDWYINGSYITFKGIRFTQQSSNFIFFNGITGGVANNIRVYQNTFDNCGNDTSADVNGILNFQPGPGFGGSGGFQPDIVRDCSIEENTFNQVKNCILYVWHGNQNINFSHNLINGKGLTENIGAHKETECIKFGNSGRASNQPPEQPNSRVAFNTVLSWRSYPYCFGYKMPGIRTICNRISDGRIELRSAGGYKCIGNVIEDGDIVIHNSGNIVKSNWVRSTTGYFSLGGLILEADSCNQSTCAQVAKNNIISDNVFYLTPNAAVWTVVWSRAEYPFFIGERPNGNVISNNIFAKGNSGTGDTISASTVIADTGNSSASSVKSTANFLNNNTWTNNKIWWANGVATPLPPGPGNVILTAAPPEIATAPTTRVVDPGDLV